tara:strand:+ start:1075 stop:1365 length:291 start_codon:yes stop_codon:yes gene_type:complete
MKRDAAPMVTETFWISRRRACRLDGVDPKTVGQDAVPDNPQIRVRIRSGLRRVPNSSNLNWYIDRYADDLTPSFPPAGIRAEPRLCASARLKQWAA